MCTTRIREGGITTYGKGKRHQALFSDAYIISEDSLDAQTPETAFVILAEDKPANFKEAMKSDNHAEWVLISLKHILQQFT